MKEDSANQLLDVLQGNMTSYNCETLFERCFYWFRRGKRTHDKNHSLIKIEGLNIKTEAACFLGKRLVHIYKTKHGYKVRGYSLNIYRLFGEEYVRLMEIMVRLKQDLIIIYHQE